MDSLKANPAGPKGEPDRGNIFLTVGSKAAQSNGSILMGDPVVKDGVAYSPEALKTMRLLFYEQNDTPMLTPKKTITVEIRDTIVREKKKDSTQPR